VGGDDGPADGRAGGSVRQGVAGGEEEDGEEAVAFESRMEQRMEAGVAREVREVRAAGMVWRRRARGQGGRRDWGRPGSRNKSGGMDPNKIQSFVRRMVQRAEQRANPQKMDQRVTFMKAVKEEKAAQGKPRQSIRSCGELLSAPRIGAAGPSRRRRMLQSTPCRCSCFS